jgi:hypothetical protein
MRYLTLGEVVTLHRAVVAATGGAEGLRDLGALESALAQPKATFDAVDLYPTVIGKAASLAFSLAMNHPFVDGNKRIAHAAMAVFLDNLTEPNSATSRASTRRANWAPSWGSFPPRTPAARGAGSAPSPRPATAARGRALIEGAWAYRHAAKVSEHIQRRIDGLPTPIQDIGWKAQVRLCKRFRRLTARGKHPNVAVTAIARELIAFMWAIAKQVPIPTYVVHQVSGRRRGAAPVFRAALVDVNRRLRPILVPRSRQAR